MLFLASSTYASRSAESLQEDRQQYIESFITQAQWSELQRISQSLIAFDGLLEHFKSNGRWWKEFMKSSDPLVYLNFPFEGKLHFFMPDCYTDEKHEIQKTGGLINRIFFCLTSGLYPILYPLKTIENLFLSVVFMGNKMETLARNGLQ